MFCGFQFDDQKVEIIFFSEPKKRREERNRKKMSILHREQFQIGQVEKNFEKGAHSSPQQDIKTTRHQHQKKKKKKKVARVLATSTEEKQNELMLDVNVDLFPLAIGDLVDVRFYESDNESYSPEMANSFRDVDYVMHGQIYKIEPARDQNKLSPSLSSSLPSLSRSLSCHRRLFSSHTQKKKKKSHLRIVWRPVDETQL